MEHLKKNSSLIAGVLFVLRSVIGLIGGTSGFNLIYHLFVFSLGIACLVDRNKMSKLILAAAVFVVGVIIFFDALYTIINGFRIGFVGIGISFITIIPAFLSIAANAIVVGILYINTRRTENYFTKFWYVPGAVSIFGTFVSILIRFISYLLYSYINFASLLRILLSCAVMGLFGVIYAVALSALGLSSTVGNNLEKVIDENAENN